MGEISIYKQVLVLKKSNKFIKTEAMSIAKKFDTQISAKELLFRTLKLRKITKEVFFVLKYLVRPTKVSIFELQC